MQFESKLVEYFIVEIGKTTQKSHANWRVATRTLSINSLKEKNCSISRKFVVHLTWPFLTSFFLKKRDAIFYYVKNLKKCLFFPGNLFRDLKKLREPISYFRQKTVLRQETKKNEWWKSVYVLMEISHQRSIYTWFGP